ncbi:MULTISPECIES: YesL family protein [unclassified Romboutsia]|uniref:YesL family protein n=1 Tax=unclassified Romboutsia TaxID=2626894 RepID=UPI001898CDC5|nr:MULTISPECIES: YesL family protein [unclassified Romboutsia]MDB8806292.1 YesL family protein [Romboutsia sp. 1001216sp1]MDB8809095.1 YesL family protein [Romboutsia sp. 1001216sp1]MDB8811940.1 YesL family protein [Romboutsia sp. 1001216sp1]MDB8817686.1 YesL family protein [Romboutsia sp. 1001216sp1]MDB8820493.1 YesL family protein [Romboutsia sp. 1001216sp1]
MDNLFRYDGKFWETLDTITDIVVLNFLFIVFSIPVITIGASLTATYSVALKKVKGEDVHVTKEFIKRFKENFKISTVVWILMIVVGSVLLLDFYISNLISDKTLGVMLKLISTIVGIIFLFNFTYVFPIISKFNNTIKNTIVNSILISIQNLPYTIIMLTMNLLCIILMFSLVDYFGYILFFYMVIGFGITSYINSIFLNKIFYKYIN